MSLLLRWMSIGCNPHCEERTQRSTRLTNLLAAIYAGFTVPYALVFQEGGYTLLVGASLFSSLAYLGVLWLNCQHRYLMAKMWLIMNATATFFAFAIICGRETGLHWGLVPIIITPALLFDDGTKESLAAMVLCMLMPLAGLTLIWAKGMALGNETPWFVTTRNVTQLTGLIQLLIQQVLWVFIRKKSEEERARRRKSQLDSAIREGVGKIAYGFSQQLNELLGAPKAKKDRLILLSQWLKALTHSSSKIELRPLPFSDLFQDAADLHSLKGVRITPDLYAWGDESALPQLIGCLLRGLGREVTGRIEGESSDIRIYLNSESPFTADSEHWLKLASALAERQTARLLVDRRMDGFKVLLSIPRAHEIKKAQPLGRASKKK